MIPAICRLLLALLAGDVVVRLAGLTVPGAVAGLCLLAGWFALRGGVDEATGRLFDRFAPHFGFVFLPVAAGILPMTAELRASWHFVAAAVVAGTLVALTTTGLIAEALFRAMRPDKEDRTC